VVVSGGVSAVKYAELLLGFARRSGARWHVTAPALEIARPSSLERRLQAMLNNHVARTPVTTTARASVTLAALTITVFVAGLAAAQAFTTSSR
jgi:hypothetical protein